MDDLADLLLRWWEWSIINSGRPRGYAHGGEIRVARISDERALAVDRAVARMGQDLPEEHHALMIYLRTGGNMTETAGRLCVSVNTARLYVQNALAWLGGWLAREKKI